MNEGRPSGTRKRDFRNARLLYCPESGCQKAFGKLAGAGPSLTAAGPHQYAGPHSFRQVEKRNHTKNANGALLHNGQGSQGASPFRQEVLFPLWDLRHGFLRHGRRFLLLRKRAFYQTACLLQTVVPRKIRGHAVVLLRKRDGYTDGDGSFQRMAELMPRELPDVPLSFNAAHEDNPYYQGITFKLYVETGHEKVEMGDGGFVDWPAKMTGNQKARCAISGIGLDRMLLL